MIKWCGAARILAILIICSLLGVYLIPPSEAQKLTAHTTYGMNSSTPGLYYATDGAYVDVLRKAQAWMSTYPMPPLSADGYPTANPVGIPSGEGPISNFSVCGYGPGRVTFNFYGKGIFTLKLAGSYLTYPGYPGGIVPGTLVTTVDSEGVTITTCKIQFDIPAPVLGGYNLATGIPESWLMLCDINPNNSPKGTPDDFHLTLDGYPTWTDNGPNPIFTNKYLQTWKPFSCMRFMGPMNTNDQTVEQTPVHWSDRNPPGIYGNGNRLPGHSLYLGPPYEDMIALCNQLDCDMWISVPLQATTDWKVGFAELVKKNLKPGLHCYMEHSNEMWN